MAIWDNLAGAGSGSGLGPMLTSVSVRKSGTSLIFTFEGEIPGQSIENAELIIYPNSNEATTFDGEISAVCCSITKAVSSSIFQRTGYYYYASSALRTQCLQVELGTTVSGDTLTVNTELLLLDTEYKCILFYPDE